MAKTKTVYVCQNCGAKESKWVGKCSTCGEWNSFVEEVEVSTKGNRVASIVAVSYTHLSVIATGNRHTWISRRNRMSGI